VPKVITTNLSALTRLQWTGQVLVDDAVDTTDNSNLVEITDQIYDDVDGGDFTDDNDFWEKGESCYSEEDEDEYVPQPEDPERGQVPCFVVVADDHGYPCVRKVPDGADPLTVLNAFKKELAANETADTDT
jgi:hypothetical protein